MNENATCQKIYGNGKAQALGKDRFLQDLLKQEKHSQGPKPHLFFVFVFDQIQIPPIHLLYYTNIVPFCWFFNIFTRLKSF